MTAKAADALDVAVRVGAALERSGAAYFLGGSLASSLQGEPRSTNDIDLVVELAAYQVPRLVTALGADFSVDEPALTASLRRGGSMNIFYLPSVMKIDLFALGATPFDQSEFARRRRIVVGDGNAHLWIKSPEDSVLRKLRWFLDGGSVSERQWRDVVAILRVCGPRLDRAYLSSWAERLSLTELIERAAGEAQPG